MLVSSLLWMGHSARTASSAFATGATTCCPNPWLGSVGVTLMRLQTLSGVTREERARAAGFLSVD